MMDSFDMELDRGKVCVTYEVEGDDIHYVKVEAYWSDGGDMFDITDELTADERFIVKDALWDLKVL